MLPEDKPLRDEMLNYFSIFFCSMVYSVIKQTTSSSFLLLSEETLADTPLGQERWGEVVRPKAEEEFIKKEKIKFIGYNRGYIDYTKENRKISTKAEIIFWDIVKNRELFGYKFRRQKVIGSFILDFYYPELLLGIELDGGYHNDRVDYDRYRDAQMYKRGILVVRFNNEDIEKDLGGVVDEIKGIIREKIKVLYPQ